MRSGSKTHLNAPLFEWFWQALIRTVHFQWSLYLTKSSNKLIKVMKLRVRFDGISNVRVSDEQGSNRTIKLIRLWSANETHIVLIPVYITKLSIHQLKISLDIKMVLISGRNSTIIFYNDFLQLLRVARYSTLRERDKHTHWEK